MFFSIYRRINISFGNLTEIKLNGFKRTSLKPRESGSGFQNTYGLWGSRKYYIDVENIKNEFIGGNPNE